MSLTMIVVAIIALWLVFGVLGMILHLFKGLLFAALIATVLVLGTRPRQWVPRGGPALRLRA